MKFKKIKLVFCFLFLISIFSQTAQAQTPPATENPVSQEAQPSPKEKKEDSLLISLDVKDADMRDIMRMFSQISGLNVVIGDDVKGTVTLSVVDVEWEDALNMILRANNLTSIKEGRFLRIMTFEKLRQEQDGVPLVNETVTLNFARAGDMAGVLDPIRSSRGRITTHTQTNTVVISEIPDNFKKMLAVIEKLDKRTPQVMIEALMLDVKLTDEEQLGINWLAADKDKSSRSFQQTLTAGRAEGIIRYGTTLLSQYDFTTTIDFWALNKRAEILANPKILTLDGLTASIELIDEIPYTQSSIASTAGTTLSSTVSFRQGGIQLYVTPQISAEGYITLNLKTQQSFKSGVVTATGTGDQPVIDSRKAETNLLVKDGETIVIGGLRKKENTKTVDKIPLLGDIPFLGKLFQKNVESVVNTELLIFVTPYIITEPQLKPSEEKNLEKFRRLKGEIGELKSLDKAKPFSLRSPK